MMINSALLTAETARLVYDVWREGAPYNEKDNIYVQHKILLVAKHMYTPPV